MSVVILLADGARPDTLDGALRSGALPALARLREEGGLHTVVSCFPSVTGPAYAPFLMGRFPGPIGLPGLRWFDRAREVCGFPDYARSYVGYQMGAVDRDIATDAPTIFELCGDALGALNVIGRGLPQDRRIGSVTPKSALRAAKTHFSGNLAGWLQIDREVASQLAARVRSDKPDFTFAALMGVDKVSHALGQNAPLIMDALRIVDDAAGTIRADAERDGRWDEMSMWIVSDHGHSPVANHDDLAGFITRSGFRTISHPWVVGIKPQVGVMVSGNAMAHLYLDVGQRKRPMAGLKPEWTTLAEALLARPSVDLLIHRHETGVVVRSGTLGAAVARLAHGKYYYCRESGDPLRIGRDLDGVTGDDVFDMTIETDYPDSIVQIVHLALAPRSGEIILSASRDWDFRARYEPIRHVSSHGALHREHMLVPLLMNRPPRHQPRRTVDVMPSALAALGRAIPAGLDGTSFL